jgi:hypothetical protein
VRFVQRYREIILHAGLGKTGSSSIQENCWRQRSFLNSRSICYPQFQLGSRRLNNHSDALSGAICVDPAEHGVTRRHAASGDAAAIAGELRSQLNAVLSAPAVDCLVLSAESVANFSDDELQVLRGLLEPHTQRLRVIAYMRSPQSTLESMLQQRVKGGNPVAEASLSGVVRSRYERLSRNFAGLIEWINFHQAIEQPGGLVGSFLRAIGIADRDIDALDFHHSNESMSFEACSIMIAINQHFPRDLASTHGVARLPGDLNALGSLPGQRFQLPDFLESQLYGSAIAEGEWLERELGMEFPPLPERDEQPLWQWQTLEVLEGHVRRLQNPHFQRVASNYLLQQAELIAGRQPLNAGALELIGRRLQHEQNDETGRLCQSLGADYFKFAALQTERHSPELALTLMSLALALKPDGSLIKERIEDYRQRLQTGEP